MKLLKLFVSVVLPVSMFSLPGLAGAAGQMIGEQEFKTHCAVCHGTDGKGRSAFTGLLTTAIPDLTGLSKRNGGVFPLNRVYEIVDGRQEIKAHGSRVMPVWGSRYNAEMTGAIDPWLPNRKEAIEKIVNTRIIELVFYIANIQK